MKVRNLIIDCAVILTLWACVQICSGQTQVENMLDRRLEPLETQADSMHLMLSQLSADYGIPIGFEAATGGEDLILSVLVQGRTLREVLDDIVKKDPRYEWRVVNGVINVRPKVHRDALLNDILETRVKVFEVWKNSNIDQVRREILKIEAVGTKLEQAHVTTETNIKLGGELTKFGNNFSLRLSDKTVREILNEIIRTSNFKYWVVNRYGKNKEFLVLNF